MRVIVLRPEPGASATVTRARALGLDAVVRPLFRVEPLAWTMPDLSDFDGLLLTSASAVRYAGPQLDRLSGLRVYAVGKATAEAATSAGLTVEKCGNGGVAALLADVDPHLRLLHLAGEERIEIDPPQSITAVPVYRAVALDPAPDFASLAPAVLLVHSPRAGERLSQSIDDRRFFRIAAISPAAAAACGPGWHSIDASAEPNDAALLSLAARLCQSSPPK